jgi:bacteriocin biosynthesis cyclodehydratase domain-containing protein
MMNEGIELRRLRLAPCMSVVRDEDRACYFVTSDRELLRFHGRLVPPLVDDVLPLLDGNRTVGELRDTLARKLDSRSVDELVHLLVQHRVVVDVAPEQAFSSRELEAFGSLLALLSRSSQEPFRLLERLRGARVVVVGSSELAGELTAALAECAIGVIDLVMEEGASLPPEVRAPVQIRTHALDQLPALIPGAALVIGVQDGEPGFPRRLRELNRMCLELGASWLEVRLTLDLEAWLGPLHAPGSACFECTELRQSSNLRSWREHQLHLEQLEKGLVAGRRLGFKPFLAQTAHAASTEVLLHLIAEAPSRLVGQCLLLDLLSHESSLQPVLRHPACLACGHPPEELPPPWSEEDVRLERTLLDGLEHRG